MKNILDFEKENFVSIWVGNFKSQEDLDEFLKENISENYEIENPINDFSKDIGIGFYDHDFQEAYFAGNESLPIKELLFPFSYSSSFIVDAVEKSNINQVEKANSAILLFDYKYEKKDDSTSRVLFLGSFNYDKHS